MTTCTECGQSSGSRLCQECRLERDHEHYQRRAEQMADSDQSNAHAQNTLQMLRQAEREGIDGASERIREIAGGDAE